VKRYNITVNGVTYDVAVEENNSGAPMAAAPAPAPAAAPAAPAAPAPAAPAAPAAAAGSVKINAPMPGTILDVKVNAGDSVKSGDVLAILEAMKMENEIMAPSDGTVAGVHVKKGDNVNSGDLLISLQ